MKKRKNHKREDVLYLTLVDFFLQMLFLIMIALLFYIAFYKKVTAPLPRPIEIPENATLIDTALRDKALDALDFIQKMGGKKEIELAIQKMKKGQGLPSCAWQSDTNGERIAKSIATFTATDSTITLLSWTPELAELHRNLGKGELKANMQWNLKGFVWAWTGVLAKYPKCRYTVTLIERTGLVRPRDHVQSVFYARIRR